MQRRPRVSVVIPTFNAEKVVRRAVASAIAQRDAGPIEIIACDDASTDGTRTVLRDLAAEHPELTVLHSAVNEGPSARRNQGIAAARGAWIAILDADDAFAPGRLARLVDMAERNTFDMIADLPVFHDISADAAEPNQPAADGTVVRIGLAELVDPATPFGVDLGLLKPVFSARLRDRGLLHYPVDVRHGEDFDLYFGLLRRGVAFGLLREAHYIFSTRIGALSRKRSPGSVTRLDFPGLARQAERHAQALIDDPDPRPDLAALLLERARIVRRSNRIHGWTSLRRGELRVFLTWLGHDPQNRKEILRIVGAKLRGHRGLPD